MASKQQAFDTLQQWVLDALDWAYDRALSGAPGIDSVDQLAASYARLPGPAWEQVGRLITMQTVKAGTAGFVTGLGGAFTLPATLPANLASVYFIQLRMIAAIARLGGYDVRDDQVRTLCYTCLVGQKAAALVQGTGVLVGQKVALNMVKKIPGAVLVKINKAVGFRLVTKMGKAGVVNLGKLTPFVGGPITAAFDATTTNTAGRAARRFFISPTGPVVFVPDVLPPTESDSGIVITSA